jgi:hypothetical protein
MGRARFPRGRQDIRHPDLAKAGIWEPDARPGAGGGVRGRIAGGIWHCRRMAESEASHIRLSMVNEVALVSVLRTAWRLRVEKRPGRRGNDEAD